MKKFSIFALTPLRRIALVVACHNAWFWVPIWVLYYRRFTDYSGVALLEALSMGVSMMMTIPGGMLADWLGRQRLLMIASIIVAVGSVGAGLSQSFAMLIPSILLLSFGGGLYQVSIHALIYDTLKSHHQEYRYEWVLGKFMTVQMLSAALASTIGGILYGCNPRYPWFAISIFMFGCLFIIRTIEEPKLEMKHDTFFQFLREAGKGISFLLRKEWMIGLPLIVIGVFLTMDFSGLWDIQAVEYGFSSRELGILLTLTYITLAIVSAFVPRYMKRLNEKSILIGLAGLFAFFWLSSAYVIGVVGGGFLIARSVFSVLFDLKASVVWNRMIPSNIRATTLSVISIIRGLPYIVVSWGVGMLLERIGIAPIVRVFSIVLFFVCVGTWGMWLKKYFFQKNLSA